MSWGPIAPARIDFGDPAAPHAPDFGDLYHSRAGALGQARHVFLGGNALPQRWAQRARFVVLEAGFGLGHNFIATRAAWRDDPARPTHLWYLAIEKHPPRRADLARALGACPEDRLATELIANWPPLTPDLHRIDCEGGRVRLLLAFGDIAQVLPELVAPVDAFYLDGFAPERNPAMWDARLLRGLHRLAAPGATLATWCVAGSVRRSLASAGFALEKAPGFGGKREMTVGRYAPRVAARQPPGRQALAARNVAVVGAGLAGAAAARALAGLGVAVQVFDRRPQRAGAALGPTCGLLHGVVHAHDGAHARWLRAAAIDAARDLAPRIAGGRVAGALTGLWRGEHRLAPAAMQATIERLGLPDDYVRAGTLPDRGAAWFYVAGGWVDAPTLVADWLEHDGIECRFETPIDAIRSASGGRWALATANGAVVAEVDAVVLANACDLTRLWPAAHWPLHAVRAQTTLLAVQTPGLPALPLPIADAGYALRLADGALLCGAASSPLADLDQADRINRAHDALDRDDHRRNLETLERLTGWRGAVDPAGLGGRAGARLHALDKMPLVGPVPQTASGAARVDQPRFVPRERGLYVLSALGSRGLTQAALAGEVLASRLAGVPVPLPAGLLDAIDPARFVARAARRAASAAAVDLRR